jgi:hypothetical protein
MTRAEHLAWCKARAHQYLAIGDIMNAVQSMMSDLQKHDEIRIDAELLALGLSIMLSNNKNLALAYIEGFT